MDNARINDYASAGERLRLSVRGLTREELLTRPPADANVGLWSIHQIVIHLMDSDLIGIDRMKRVIAEDNPLLLGYNEARFAERLHYEEQSLEDAITILDLSRRLFAGVLRKLPEDVFQRTGVHNEAGKITLAEQIEKYREHFDHHLKFIHDKRKWMKREM